MTGEQFSLLFIMVITVGYWVKTVIIGSRDEKYIFTSAIAVAGSATFVGLLFNLFIYKFIGEIIGGILGLWVSDRAYKECYSEEKEE